MRERKRVTIHDVARDCGLALSTVSNALAGKPHVSEPTRHLVHEASERLGYRASAVARGLRMQRSFTIGVLVADIADPATPGFFRGIEDVAIREKCTVFLCNTDDDPRKQGSEMRALLDHQVDGMVLIAQHTDAPEIRALLQNGTPYVQVQLRSLLEAADYVGADNADGILAAVAHLAGLGHRRIGHITGRLDSPAVRERLEAFQAGIAAHGLDAGPELVCHGDDTAAAGQRFGHVLLSLGMPPTAVMASNDVNALGVIQAASERRIDVPRQLSVVGLDDIAAAAFHPVGLTTIHVPRREIGAAAAELLMRRIRARRDMPPRTTIFPTRLVVRGSTAAAPVLVQAKRRAS